MLVLHVLQGPDRGKKFELPEGEPQLIGRSSEALPISDNTVSRRHAELTPDDGRWLLRDLDSANGTFVNGHRIAERVELAPGDQVRCGSTLFTFGLATDDPERPSPVRIMPAEMFDLSVEGTTDSNEDSMILAAPDPVKAAMDHLRVIYDLTALTASTFDRDELLERVMDLIFEEFQADRGFILLMTRPTDTPQPAVVRYKQRPKSQDEGRIPVSRTIIEHTLARGEGLLSTNAMNDRRFRSGDSVRDYGIRSAICVPMTAGERTFGVIHIDSSLANFTFTDAQLRLMTAIGQHTALVLHSSEVVEERMQTERLAAMGQTVASLSHSIKNILQGLRSGADAVEMAINRGDLGMAEKGWPILTRNIERILALTMNMLTYSRQPELDVDLLPLHEVIREAAALIQPQCEQKRVGLILDLSDDMPPIPADANALHQAMMNLLANAMEAAPARSGLITVKTAFDAQRHEARISVSDNGPGIPSELHEKVFDPFFSSKGQRGTGLGLAVTRKIVEEHGGTMELDSEPGRGASFTMALPSDHETLSSGETALPRPMPDPDFGSS